jgi:AraC family transcriptional regulator
MPTRRKTLPQPGPDALAELLTTIEKNLDGDLSLAVLARRAGMSTSCFSRWFRAQTGVTPHAFVVEARIERAKALLRSSDLPLLDVALAVGFSSQSCLNVTFRRHAGMTPADYRRQVSTKAKDGADTCAQESLSRCG